MSLHRIITTGLLATIALCAAARSEPAAPSPEAPKNLVVAPVAGSASAVEDPAGIQSAAKLSNAFGTKVFNLLLGPGAGTTVMMSPASLTGALDMLTLGAGADTAALLRRARGIGQTPKAADRQGALHHSLVHASTPDVTVRIANSAWLKPKASPMPAFVTALHDLYDASVTNVDFANPSTVGTVNGWVKQNTQDVIDHIVDQLAPETEFLLVNTTYFKGKWAVPFDASQTKPEPFTRADGSKHDVPMMSGTATLRYAQTPRWHAVAIPYHGDRFEMIVMTAKDSAKSAAVRRELGQKGFLQALHGLQFAPRDINLRLPRFRAEYGAELNAVLARVGLGPALGGKADYRPMTSEPIQAIKVVQRAVVEVNEEGTEAAAATAVVGTRSANARTPLEFAADRPFAFGIVDRTTGAVLFIGYVADPSA